MEILTQAEFRLRKEEILQKIKEGAIFIHPTDTIYGLGCHAQNQKSVQKIRKLKERPDTPFSIWIPSLDWAEKNCSWCQSTKCISWIGKLPGPYTLIAQLKNKKAIASNVNPKEETIGLRYPKHWFSQVVEELGFPIVTTSANRSGQPFMISLKKLDQDIEKGVEFIIYEGEKEARPSKIVDLSNGEVKER